MSFAIDYFLDNNLSKEFKTKTSVEHDFRYLMNELSKPGNSRFVALCNTGYTMDTVLKEFYAETNNLYYIANFRDDQFYADNMLTLDNIKTMTDRRRLLARKPSACFCSHNDVNDHKTMFEFYKKFTEIVNIAPFIVSFKDGSILYFFKLFLRNEGLKL